MAINTNNAFLLRWHDRLSYLLVLQDKMASPLCAQNKAQGYESLGWLVITEQPVNTFSQQAFRPMKHTPTVLSLGGFFQL